MNHPYGIIRSSINRRGRKNKFVLFLAIFLGVIGVSLTLCFHALMDIKPANIEYPIMLISMQLDIIAFIILLTQYRAFKLKGLLISGCAILILGWLFFCGALNFAQDRILFAQPKLSVLDQYVIKNVSDHIDNLSVKAADQVSLNGWIIHNSTVSKAPLIIFFGGNNEAQPPYWLSNLKGWTVVWMNYRGYGLSEGVPSEQNLKNDALTIYDTLAKRADINKGNIVMMGRSLGTGIAAYVASKRPVKGVVLISPYDSIKRVTEDQFPLIPGLFIKNEFNAAMFAKTIKVPLLTFYSNSDLLIYPQRSKALIQAWAGESKVQVVEGASHNNLINYPIVQDETNLFLHKISG
ncbi:MAG: hypothetical protein JWM44_727 [Bacilli bacterium]|nr:hypothetical protein [Bacilli bacterium]